MSALDATPHPAPLHRLAARAGRAAALPVSRARGSSTPRPFYVKADQALDGAQLRARLHLRVAHAAALRAGRRVHRTSRSASAARAGTSASASRGLGVPFLFGVFLVLIPAQTWYGARFNSGTRIRSGTTWSAATSCSGTSRTAATTSAASASGTCGSSSSCCSSRVIALPLLASRGRGGALLQSLSRRLAHPAWWLVAALLIMLGAAVPDPTDALEPFYYLVFFVLGYVVVRDPALHGVGRAVPPAGAGARRRPRRLVGPERRACATRCPTRPCSSPGSASLARSPRGWSSWACSATAGGTWTAVRRRSPTWPRGRTRSTCSTRR